MSSEVGEVGEVGATEIPLSKMQTHVVMISANQYTPACTHVCMYMGLNKIVVYFHVGV